MRTVCQEDDDYVEELATEEAHFLDRKKYNQSFDQIKLFAIYLSAVISAALARDKSLAVSWCVRGWMVTGR